MIGGRCSTTYISPETSPSNIPNKIVNINIINALLLPPPKMEYVILAPNTEESAAIDPKEKSKRPLFKLMDNAIVVIITIAIYTTKLSKPVMFEIIVFPLNMQIPCNNTATSTGIVNVPITFFTKCLFLFFMLSSPFIFQDIPYPLQINEFLTFHLFGESTASK